MPENKELIKKKKNQVSEELDGRGEDEAPSRCAVRNLCVAAGGGQVPERAAMGRALLGMLKEPWLVGLFAFLGGLCSNGKGLWQGWWLLLCWGWHTGPQQRVPGCL